MLEEARRRAAEEGIRNADWVRIRAEDLPAGLGSFDVVTFAQSFHWVERLRVAAAVRTMLPPDGTWVHVHATTHAGTGDDAPPHDAIEALVTQYLGPVRRAGRRFLPNGTATGEEDIMRAAGFSGPRRVQVSGRVVERSADDVVASVFSRSSSAPHLLVPASRSSSTNCATCCGAPRRTGGPRADA